MSKTLIIVLGPPAVGKMTVGFELARLTGFKFMHNHQTIEAILPIFPFGSPSFVRLLFDFRRAIFEEVAAGDASGFIYTTAWDLGSSLDRMEIDSYCEPFRRRHAQVYFLELEAALETRIARNKTELRLLHKLSKRDVKASEERLVRVHERTKGATAPFPYPGSHLKIVNEDLSARDVALLACRHFAINTAPI